MLDTNIVVSGLIWGGVPRRLLDLARDGEILVILGEAYERNHYPLDLPDPVEAIKFEMEQKGLTVKDLEPMIGGRKRVYEILNYKRWLTLKMIWRLHEQLGIPAESLIKKPSHPDINNVP